MRPATLIEQIAAVGDYMVALERLHQIDALR
jgi:hypothetical protein